MPTRGGEDLDEAIAVARYVVVPCSVLLGISDKENSTDVLYIEGRKPTWNSAWTVVISVMIPIMISVVIIVAVQLKCAITQLYALEVSVVNFHCSRAEIRDVEEPLSVDFARCCALIDGTVGATLV